MKILQAFKFRISNPGRLVSQRLDYHLNLCCELYNAALQERRDAWRLNRVSINYFDQAKQLKEIRVCRREFKNIYAQILQDVLKRVEKAFQAFFKRIKQAVKAGYPRFKPTNRYHSFTFSQGGFSLTGNKLTLSKMGVLTLILSRKVTGRIKTLTIKKELNNWVAIFTVETKSEPLEKTGQAIGIDVGIESFATLSDGTRIDNFKFFETTQKELRRAQRSVARKKKGSSNRQKAVLKLRKIHQRISNRRLDFLHKLTTKLIKSYDLIAIEKLNISGLSKGILAKQILDCGWGIFFKLLNYKAGSAGKKVIEVNPNGTSQICSKCGSVAKKTLSVRLHQCKCGLRIHRDHNAALNILRSGIDLLALSLPLGEFAKEAPRL